jgi:hypothetical protein
VLGILEVTALDCESRDSALASIAAIYEVAREDIDDFLRLFDIDKYYAENAPSRSADNELLLLFEGRFGSPRVPPSTVYWFHLTRVLPAVDFAHGIKPLSAALDDVWDTVCDVFKGTAHEEGLKALRSGGVPDHAYVLKLSSPVHGGPFGMLVRDSAFRAEEMWNHDYLSLPEIMEDICNGYLTAYRQPIHDQLRDALMPCGVKFWSRRQIEGCIRAAMYYLYCTAHNRRLTIDANTCYDGGNERVPPEQIVKVEFVST